MVGESEGCKAGSHAQTLNGSFKMKKYLPFILLFIAAAWGFTAYVNDATFVAYVPSLLLVLWAYDS